ncbi:MAG: BrnT family toxin [Chloroflexia bacterium]|nr:BrnT family toxin [Chloroflexia bacterium]
MRFEWDERKNASNFRKHGVSFEVASEVFGDPLVSSRQDRHVNGEERWTAIGWARRQIVFVAFTLDESGGEEVVKIISARGADRQERRDYERGT